MIKGLLPAQPGAQILLARGRADGGIILERHPVLLWGIVNDDPSDPDGIKDRVEGFIAGLGMIPGVIPANALLGFLCYCSVRDTDESLHRRWQSVAKRRIEAALARATIKTADTPLSPLPLPTIPKKEDSSDRTPPEQTDRSNPTPDVDS